MKLISKAKLVGLLSTIGGAIYFWRRPARTTEVTIRRRPVASEEEETAG